ncbi:deoxyribonuclease V [Kitasatospora terrestris]|uniref:deoxyribonuclease V n=1 Tax=Kitasatospora terrestris TaxID=258051 RepID=UPI003CD0771E
MANRQFPDRGSPAVSVPPDWPTGETEALAEQERLRPQVVTEGPAPDRTPGVLVAGVDVAYDDEKDVVAAAAVLLDYATLEVVEETTAVGPVAFPYLPGLLAFRELPAVTEALRGLTVRPEVVVCDGYGLAHPRRFGLASHLGVLTGLRTIGVAKTPFVFEHREPGPRRGDWSPLLDRGETVGRAVRTREGVKPVFVSVGHRIGLTEAAEITLALAPHYRLPETTRRADSLCRRALAAETAADVQ